MCGIAGILNSKQDVTGLVTKMLSTMATRGPDGIGLATESDTVYLQSIADFNPNLIRGKNVLGHSRLAIVGGHDGSQPFFGCNKKFSLLHNGEIYNYKELRKKLVNHNFLTDTDSEVIIHLLEEEYTKNNGNFLNSIKKSIEQLDGIFSIVIKEESTGKIVLVRDRLGVRPLYYLQDKDFFMFASEKKAFWAIQIFHSIKSVPPASIVIVDRTKKDSNNEILSYDLKKLVSREKYVATSRTNTILYQNTNSAIKAYRDSLINSVKKRTQDLKKIGIIFSGGIDSVLIAFLAKRFVPEVICYTCGIESSHDIQFAKHVSKLLDFTLKVREFTQDEVEKLLPKIMYIIEDNNVGQVEVAIPVFGAVNLAQEDDIRVMLTGQGADELFGGYSWYPKIIQKKGYTKTQDLMFEDLNLLYKETLEREDKITMANSIEVREPYLDSNVVKTALQTNLRLNVRNHNNVPDSLGKRIHRLLAKQIGIPEEISYRIKEAAQHGSGIHFILDNIARKNGYDETKVTNEYLDYLKIREKIGSSQRYGHYFEKEKIWSIDPHIQLYLDTISSKILPAV